MVQRTKNQNDLDIGLWNAECDRCGFKFKNVDLKKEWQGLMTCRDCWEIRQPLDFVRGVPDDPSVPWTRPVSASADTVSVSGETLLGINGTACTVSSIPGEAIPSCVIPGYSKYYQNPL